MSIFRELKMTPEHMKIGKFSFKIRAIEDLFLLDTQ